MAVAFLALVVTVGCHRGVVSGPTEGPYLDPGPLAGWPVPVVDGEGGVQDGTAVAVTARPAVGKAGAAVAGGVVASGRDAAVAGRAAAVAGSGASSVAAGVPADFMAAGGLRPLPGAALSGIGPVTAMVVPVSVGAAVPTWTPEEIEDRLFGGDFGAVKVLRSASSGSFRLSAEVMPVGVAVEVPDLGSDRAVRRFAEEVLRDRASRFGLARFDNDGADGVAGSRDDDGVIDLVMIAVEAAGELVPRTVRADLSLRDVDGRQVRVDLVHLVPLPRGGREAPVRAVVERVLYSLGFGTSGLFPATFTRQVATLARARLGWLPLDGVGPAGEIGLHRGRGSIAPLVDTDGFWLVESEADTVFASRIVRLGPGRFEATDQQVYAASHSLHLPLDRQRGARGPTVAVRLQGSGRREAVVPEVPVVRVREGKEQ